jgi:hypothetical protein
MFPEKPIFTYVGMALAACGIAAGVLYPDYANFIWTIAALLGFGSWTALREYVNSKGWKTRGLFAVVVLLTVLQWTGVITPEAYNGLMAAFLPLFGITYQQAQAKAGILLKKKKAA